jgi:hypothetical protein
MQNSFDPSHQGKPRFSLASVFHAVGDIIDALRPDTGIDDAPENLSPLANKAVSENDPRALGRVLKIAAARSPHYEYGLTMHSLSTAITHANPEMVGILLEFSKELSSRSAEFTLAHPFRMEALLRQAENRAKELHTARVEEDLDEALLHSLIHRRGDPNIYQIGLAADLAASDGQGGSVSRGVLARAWRQAEEKHRAPGTDIYAEMQKTLALMQSAAAPQPRHAPISGHFSV